MLCGKLPSNRVDVAVWNVPQRLGALRKMGIPVVQKALAAFGPGIRHRPTRELRWNAPMASRRQANTLLQ
jgi:hypothetical protein